MKAERAQHVHGQQPRRLGFDDQETSDEPRTCLPGTLGGDRPPRLPSLRVETLHGEGDRFGDGPLVPPYNEL